MFKHNVVIGAAFLAVTLTTAARADLGLEGSVGMPLNPTAEIPAPDQEQWQVGYRDLGDLTLFGLTASKVKNYTVQGAYSPYERLELDFGYDQVNASDPLGLGTNGLDQKRASFGGKYLLTRATGTKGFSTAVGIGYDRALFRNTFGYLVVSKPLALFGGDDHPTLVSLGVRHDHFSLGDIGGPSSSKWSAYTGVEVPLIRQGALGFVAEVGSKNNDAGREKTPYSYGLHSTLAGGRISAGVGYQRQGITGDGGLYALVSIKTKK
jgi:hypothetical protein